MVSIRNLAAAYLLFESAALAAYWLLLALRPAMRAPFVPPGGDERALFAFAAGDLTVYGMTGLAAGLALLRRPRQRWWLGPCLFLHAGAAMYASLFAITLWPMDTDRWLGGLMMLPALVVPIAIARLFGRS